VTVDGLMLDLRPRSVPVPVLAKWLGGYPWWVLAAESGDSQIRNF
jgi:hypothetical protein